MNHSKSAPQGEVEDEFEKLDMEEWLRIGFLTVFVVGIACAVLIIFSYYAKK